MVKKKYVFPVLFSIGAGSDLERDVVKVALSDQDKEIEVTSSTLSEVLNNIHSTTQDIENHTNLISARLDTTLSSIESRLMEIKEEIDLLLKYFTPMEYYVPRFIFVRRYSIPNGGSKSLLIHNPSNSNKTAKLMVTVRGLGNAEIDIHTYIIVSSYGTDVSDYAKTLDLSYYGLKPKLRIYEDPSFDQDPNPLTDILQGGISPKPIGDFNTIGERLTMPPNTKIAIVVRNTSGANNYYSIKLTWYEV